MEPSAKMEQFQQVTFVLLDQDKEPDSNPFSRPHYHMSTLHPIGFPLEPVLRIDDLFVKS